MCTARAGRLSEARPMRRHDSCGGCRRGRDGRRRRCCQPGGETRGSREWHHSVVLDRRDTAPKQPEQTSSRRDERSTPMQLKNLMTREVEVIHPNATLQEAAEKMEA